MDNGIVIRTEKVGSYEIKCVGCQKEYNVKKSKKKN